MTKLSILGAATIAFTACGPAPDPMGYPAKPYPPPDGPAIVALNPVSQPGWAGLRAIWGPSIRVLDQNRSPASNLIVTFAVTRGEGSVSNASVTTNQDGVAGTDWVLGPLDGTNTVLVSVPSMSSSISFNAEAKVEPIIARYDLIEVGGSPLPGSYLVSGGHYLLKSDNSFDYGYDFDGVSHVTPYGTFVQLDANTIQFVLSPGSYGKSSLYYGPSNGLFATGRIEGDVMTVTYVDNMDYYPETYVRSFP
ncbi:MAG TPA: hypothetical protein VIM36_14855 [Gemmatimonadaceae bacterium]